MPRVSVPLNTTFLLMFCGWTGGLSFKTLNITSYQILSWSLQIKLTIKLWGPKFSYRIYHHVFIYVFPLLSGDIFRKGTLPYSFCIICYSSITMSEIEKVFNSYLLNDGWFHDLCSLFWRGIIFVLREKSYWFWDSAFWNSLFYHFIYALSEQRKKPNAVSIL